jgi:hypothetical protein
MDSLLMKARQIYFDNVSEFQKACVLYKSMLDRNVGGRFCIGEHCRTVFVVEILMDNSKWGATPKIFYSREEAEREIEALKVKYSFVSECRILTRKEKED